MDPCSQEQTWEKPGSENCPHPSHQENTAQATPGPGDTSGKAPFDFRLTLLRPAWAVCMHARQSGFGLSNTNNKQSTNKLQANIFLGFVSCFFFFQRLFKKTFSNNKILWENSSLFIHLTYQNVFICRAGTAEIKNKNKTHNTNCREAFDELTKGVSQARGEMLHQHCTSSVGLGWPQSSNRHGLHQPKIKVSLGPTVGSSSLTLLWISLVEQLICCLGRGSWGRHWVLLRPQQKLEKSWCLCAHLYIDALFCRSTTHCCEPKISFCPAVVYLPTSNLQSMLRSNQKKLSKAVSKEVVMKHLFIESFPRVSKSKAGRVRSYRLCGCVWHFHLLRLSWAWPEFCT